MRLVLLALAGVTPVGMRAVPARLFTWPDLVGRPRPAPDATISYGRGALQRADVWLPAGKTPFRTVMVHGGCGTTGIAERGLTAGHTVSLRFVPGTGHVELIAPESAAWAEAKRLIAGAFDKG